jgi:DNA replication licensing factor MCM4
MGAAGRKMREDMRCEIVKLLGGAMGIKGVKWHKVVRLLGEQSSVRIDAGEFGEVVKKLEREGALIIVGERDRRVIRRVDGV